MFGEFESWICANNQQHSIVTELRTQRTNGATFSSARFLRLVLTVRGSGPRHRRPLNERTPRKVKGQSDFYSTNSTQYGSSDGSWGIFWKYSCQTQCTMKSSVFSKARLMYQLADIIGRYRPTADISVLAVCSPISANIKTLFFFQDWKNALTSNLKWYNHCSLSSRGQSII